MNKSRLKSAFCQFLNNESVTECSKIFSLFFADFLRVKLPPATTSVQNCRENEQITFEIGFLSILKQHELRKLFLGAVEKLKTRQPIQTQPIQTRQTRRARQPRQLIQRSTLTYTTCA